MSKKEVVFIDSGVQDYQTLVNGIGSDKEIVLLDSSKNALSQMASWAQTHTGYDAIHLFSHGSSGALTLGNMTLDNANIADYADTLSKIGSSLSQTGDILLYGCDVAEGEAGIDFIGRLAQATGADVAASDDLTGSSSLGGDWVLEAQTGTVDVLSLQISNYNGLLAGINIDQDIYTGSVDYERMASTGSIDTTSVRLDITNQPTGVKLLVSPTSISPLLVLDDDGTNDYTIADVADSGQTGYDLIDDTAGEVGGYLGARVDWDTYTSGDLVVDVYDAANVLQKTVTFTFTPVPTNAAPTVSDTPADVTVTEDTASDFNLSAVTVADADGNNLTVTLTASAGTFAASTSGSVTVGGSDTGTLMLSGLAADINTWLDTTSNIQYTGASNASGDNAATFTLKANDGTVDSTVANGNIDITDANHAPTITELNNDSVVWADVGNAVVLDASSNATVSDTENDAANWNGSSLTVQRSGTAITSDQFGFNLTDASFTVSGSALQSGDQTFATFTNESGVLTISFANGGADATNALMQDVLRHITYRNDTPPGDATIHFSLSDGVAATTADVTVTSDFIYVTTTTDTATVNLNDSVAFSEALAIANSQSGTETLVLANANYALGSDTTLTGPVIIDADAADGKSLTGQTISVGTDGLTFKNGVGANDSGDTFTISTALAGSGDITFSSPGNYYGNQDPSTFILAGTNSTATGKMIVNMAPEYSQDGVLQIATDTNLSAGELVFDSGGLKITGSSTIDNAINFRGGLPVYLTQTGNTTNEFSGEMTGAGGFEISSSNNVVANVSFTGTNTNTLGVGVSNYATLTLNNTNNNSAIKDTASLSIGYHSKVILSQSSETIGILSAGDTTATLNLESHALTVAGSGSSSFAGTLIGEASSDLIIQDTDAAQSPSIFSVTSSQAAMAGFLGTTTVDTGGKLQINSAAYLGGNVVVGNTGILQGDGTVLGSVTVESGGTLGAGITNYATAAGDLEIRDGLTVEAGGALSVTLNGTTAGTQYDQIKVIGGVDISGATLSLGGNYTAQAGNTFKIIDNDGSDVVTGTFNGLNEGASITVNGVAMTLSYLGGDGNDVTLTAPAATDTTAPTLVGQDSSPADNATGVAVGSNIEIAFSEDIKFFGTQFIALSNPANPDEPIAIFHIQAGVLNQSIGGTLTIDGNKIIINPSSDLLPGAEYLVGFGNQAISDLAGNTMGAIADYSFTTVDNDNEVTSGDFYAVDLGTSTISINTNNDDNIVQDLFFDVSKNNSASWKVTGADVEDGAAFNEITGKGNNDALVSGDKLFVKAEDGTIKVYQIVFVSGNDSGDTTAPTINAAGSTPADDATSVSTSADIIVAFGEPLDASSDLTKVYLKDVTTDTLIPATVTINSSGQLVINPTANLGYSTAYYVTWDADALKDAAGNSAAAVADETTFNFATASAPSSDPAPTPTHSTDIIDHNNISEMTTTTPVTTTVGTTTVMTQTGTGTRTFTDNDGHAVTQSNVTVEAIQVTASSNSSSATTAVPLYWGETTKTEWATTASISSGVTLSSEGNRAPTNTQTKATAIDDLMYYIQTTVPSTDSTKTEMLGGGSSFLSALSHIETLVVNKVVLSNTTSTTTPATVSLDGTANTITTGGITETPKEALVIDGNSLAAGSTVTLSNIEFGVLTGSNLNVVLSGTATQTLFTGSGTQTLTTSNASLNQLHAGGGDDSFHITAPATNILTAQRMNTSGSESFTSAIAQKSALYGEDGNDTVSAESTGTQNMFVHGGSGTDSISYQGSINDYTITKDEGITYIHANGSSKTDIVLNVENIQFSDGTSYTVQNSDQLVQIASLYQQVLGRQAEVDGFQYWAHGYNSSNTIGNIAIDFIQSNEYFNKTNILWDTMSNDAKIETFYTALLGRASEAAGKSYWMDAINNGKLSIEQIAEGFVTSVEMQGNYLSQDAWSFIA